VGDLELTFAIFDQTRLVMRDAVGAPPSMAIEWNSAIASTTTANRDRDVSGGGASTESRTSINGAPATAPAQYLDVSAFKIEPQRHVPGLFARPNASTASPGSTNWRETDSEASNTIQADADVAPEMDDPIDFQRGEDHRTDTQDWWPLNTDS